MRRDVEHLRVARINDYVIDKQARAIQVYEQSPGTCTIRGRVNLAVERAEVEAVWIVRIDNQRTNVSATWTGNPPIARVRNSTVGCVRGTA
jgi:hypothetical protein